ncbi:hypothetical protein YC2023_011440 [Brassica napus]
MVASSTNPKKLVFGKQMEKKLFTSLLLFTMFSGISFAGITTESPLSIGQTLSSSNEIYELGFFSPPDNSQNQYVGIWFKGIIPRVVVWVANREKPVTDSTAHLAININGSLLLLDGKHGVLWSTRESSASNGSRAELSDEGNLIVTDNVSGRRLWESFENLGDTLLPFSPLTYNLATGEKRVLTSWKSYTDPSRGDFVAHITPQVPSQLFTMRGSTPYYRTGPWAKTRFSGIPLMDETLASPFSFQQDANRSGSFSYVDRSSKLSRLLITSEGTLMRFRHIGTEWEVSYQAPANPCDVYGVCGPFGLCIMSDSPKCKCFKGFVPKFPEEWNRGNWTGGCIRRTELDCQGNSTGKLANVFHPVANIKPPDFYTFVSSVDAEDCYQSCLHNCSCLAFAYIRGIGCLIWNQELIDVMQFSAGGEILSIRLARSELGRNKHKKTILAFAVSISLFVILGSAAYGFYRYKVKHNAIITTDASEDSWRRKGLKPQDVPGLNFFEMNTIETATNNFSLSNKLGQGGFGSVYKGKLQDRKEIAVKRLSSSSGQGKEEFMNEIIDWPKRFSIIQGIARGLLYLHRDSRLKVIHRDLKVSNILLDEKMTPKISDFGLARMYQGTEYQDNTRRVVGTLGYMAPEYAWTGTFSEKSDIYSFGVLLLEIISGEKISRFSYGEEGKTLLAYAWESWYENGGIDLLDKDVANSYRPNTLELMSLLTTTSDLQSPEQPTFSVHKRDDRYLCKGLSTVNEITQSAILGR